MKRGNSVTVIAQREFDRPLYDPDYLPSWARRYPGSVVQAKLGYYEGQQLVAVSIIFESKDDLASVTKFYENVAKDLDISDENIVRIKNSTFFYVNPDPLNKHSISVKSDKPMSGPAEVDIVFAWRIVPIS